MFVWKTRNSRCGRVFPVPVLKLEIVSVYKSFFFNPVECWWKKQTGCLIFFYVCAWQKKRWIDGREGGTVKKRESCNCFFSFVAQSPHCMSGTSLSHNSFCMCLGFSFSASSSVSDMLSYSLIPPLSVCSSFLLSFSASTSFLTPRYLSNGPTMLHTLTYLQTDPLSSGLSTIKLVNLFLQRDWLLQIRRSYN